jgi:hypothetical protein
MPEMWEQEGLRCAGSRLRGDIKEELRLLSPCLPCESGVCGFGLSIADLCPLDQCPLLALNGHAQCADECPLLGVKRTWCGLVSMSVNDPNRTFAFFHHAVVSCMNI